MSMDVQTEIEVGNSSVCFTMFTDVDDIIAL
jgi:hypothetical protein